MLLKETTNRVYDNLTTAVLLFDAQLRLLSINAAGEHLLSVSNSKMTGLSPLQMFPGAVKFDAMLQRTLDADMPFSERGMVLPLAYREERTVDCNVTPVRDGEGHIEIIVELTDALEFHREIHNESLTVLHDASREAVRGMAHEIRNPLGGIRGAAQLLQAELDNEELIEYTNIIIQESDRLRNFVDQMLASDQKLNCIDLNVYEVIDYVCNLVQAEFDQCPEFHRDFDPSLPTIKADREQMIQILLNVIRNALQATDCKGQVSLQTRIMRQFTIRQKKYRMVVRIDIIDDGPGIPAELEKNIFYPMITGRADGTGLGLSIAQSLVNLHGGLIDYQRQDEKTVFSIYLPVGNQ